MLLALQEGRRVSAFHGVWSLTLASLGTATWVPNLPCLFQTSRGGLETIWERLAFLVGLWVYWHGFLSVLLAAALVHSEVTAHNLHRLTVEEHVHLTGLLTVRFTKLIFSKLVQETNTWHFQLLRVKLMSVSSALMRYGCKVIFWQKLAHLRHLHSRLHCAQRFISFLILGKQIGFHLAGKTLIQRKSVRSEGFFSSHFKHFTQFSCCHCVRRVRWILGFAGL